MFDISVNDCSVSVMAMYCTHQHHAFYIVLYDTNLHCIAYMSCSSRSYDRSL
uniref:Uncharacterized protein n=1 Tax=Arundo donax TaxID=35708 RepID=A0A0A9FFA7_ARUDO